MTSSFDDWLRAQAPQMDADFEWLSGGASEQRLVPEIMATQIGVSLDLMMDCGAIPDTREHKPLTRRTWLRYWLAGRREDAARLAYRLIAGTEVPEQDY